MRGARESFLNRVRDAVRTGNRPGQAADIPDRAGVGYQHPAGDLVTSFCQQFAAAGGVAHIATTAGECVDKTVELARMKGAKSILLGHGEFLDSLNLAAPLRSRLSEAQVHEIGPNGTRDLFFGADLAISGVHALVAESGTVVALASPAEPRSLTLLPPVHIAVAHRGQILADLFDLFDGSLAQRKTNLPSCVSLITGPSKTGDIELRLVTGVHGPGEVHLILLDA